MSPACVDFAPASSSNMTSLPDSA